MRSDVPSTRHDTVSCAEAISLALVTPRGVSIMHLGCVGTHASIESPRSEKTKNRRRNAWELA